MSTNKNADGSLFKANAQSLELIEARREIRRLKELLSVAQALSGTAGLSDHAGFEGTEAMKALRGPLSRRATSAEFSEWMARDVVQYIDLLKARAIKGDGE